MKLFVVLVLTYCSYVRAEMTMGERMKRDTTAMLSGDHVEASCVRRCNMEMKDSLLDVVGVDGDRFYEFPIHKAILTTEKLNAYCELDEQRRECTKVCNPKEKIGWSPPHHLCVLDRVGLEASMPCLLKSSDDVRDKCAAVCSERTSQLINTDGRAFGSVVVGSRALRTYFQSIAKSCLFQQCFQRCQRPFIEKYCSASETDGVMEFYQNYISSDMEATYATLKKGLMISLFPQECRSLLRPEKVEGITIREQAPKSVAPACEFQCSNGGKCIPRLWICDGTSDCADGLDERNCGKNCTKGRFACNNGRCAPTGVICDGDDDCRDGSDEQNCPNVLAICQSSLFTCGPGSRARCIPRKYQCDGDRDCADGSDEICDECPVGRFRCTNGQCIHAVFRCDGDNHCRDGSDEADSLCAEHCALHLVFLIDQRLAANERDRQRTSPTFANFMLKLLQDVSGPTVHASVYRLYSDGSSRMVADNERHPNLEILLGGAGETGQTNISGHLAALVRGDSPSSRRNKSIIVHLTQRVDVVPEESAVGKALTKLVTEQGMKYVVMFPPFFGESESVDAAREKMIGSGASGVKPTAVLEVPITDMQLLRNAVSCH